MSRLRDAIGYSLACTVLLSLGLSACMSAPSIALGNIPTATEVPDNGTAVALLFGIPSAATRTSRSTPEPTDQITPSETPERIATRSPSPSVTPTIEHSPTATATLTPTSTPSPTGTPRIRPTPTTIPAAMRQQIFEKIWQTIDEHYLYADFDGLDWDEIWLEYVPRVQATDTSDEFYALMTEMVDLLDDHHSRFLAPNDAVEESTLNVGRETRVGIGVIISPTQDGAIIQQVFSNSPAAQAGLRPRDRIIAVDGTPFISGGTIHGKEGSQVRLTVERPDDQTHEVVLVRQHVEGKISPGVRRFPGDIGYLSIPTLWVNDMSDQVSGALTDLVVEKPLNGLILDLRGNPGGWRDVLTGVLSHFVQGDAGVFFDRKRTRSLVIRETSGPDLRDLPLVVLIDRQTASYAEVLAAILQAEAGALVVGAPSAGNTETIYAYELIGGGRLWVAQEGFRLRNGINLEGQGVQPDLRIDLDWTRYSEAKDPHILAAREHLTRH